MTDTSATPPAKKAAHAPVSSAASVTALRMGEMEKSLKDLHGKLDLLLNAFPDLHTVVQSVHEQLDSLTVRANEAEKLLNSPAAKVVRGAQKVWTGLK